MANWKPPKFGSPVWLGISANDVSRAERFYATVFNWTFKDHNASNTTTTTTTQDTSSGPQQQEQQQQPATRLFDFNPDVALSGGLQSRASVEGTGAPAAGPGGTCVFWLVEDIDKIASAIEQAGGKMLGSGEPIKEGESGLYRYFEDTEGNVGAVYQYLGA